VYVANYKYKEMIHHVSGSTAEFTAAAVSFGVQRGLIMPVQHAILAHHGRKECGIVKDLQTLEAWILHSCDYSSSHFGPRKDK
jgi:23S rRNA maturation-related 3'-5' exoribonuclease YhaM